MRSIRLKLWAGMMVLVLVVLVLLWLFQIVFLESYYARARIADIRKEASAIVKRMEEGDRTAALDNMEAFSFENNLGIEILDLQGNTKDVLGQTGNTGQVPMMKSGERAQAFQDVLAGKKVEISLIHPRFGNKFMLIGLPVEMNGEIQEAIMIVMPMAPVQDTASILKRQLAMISVVLATAALLISFLISRGFTRPILAITKASEIMASGDFDVRIPFTKKDEIGKLAKTINHLGEQLSKIEQLRKDLIANVSHELRTPLSLIRGYAETLRDVTGDISEKREKQLGIIIEETDRLTRIVDDILNYSQLQSGYFTLNLSAFKVRDCLDRVVKRYEVHSEKTGVAIRQEYEGNSTVLADESRVEQVLFNLISNAFNHTQEGGVVRIRVVEKEKSLRIEVSDTGIGIPEEEMPYIWDRYYKSGGTGAKRAIGTGLGLAIVKSLLEAHQVQFGAESAAERGTTFWFELKRC
ncbi:MAG TPA: hypothetical protein DD727_05665 [Clostridiales bacterium]|nr:hypothetical protein [Clostridiales bacterium]